MMWSLLNSWMTSRVRPQRARRRRPVAAVAVEALELRQLLSATMGHEAIAAEVSIESDARAVPRVDGVAGDYTFFDGEGTMTITQNGLNIHAVISRPEDEPNGDFDAAFKKATSKVAKGEGFFTFADESSSAVKVKIKFKPAREGGFNFNYHYRKLKTV